MYACIWHKQKPSLAFNNNTTINGAVKTQNTTLVYSATHKNQLPSEFSAFFVAFFCEFGAEFFTCFVLIWFFISLECVWVRLRFSSTDDVEVSLCVCVCVCVYVSVCVLSLIHSVSELLCVSLLWSLPVWLSVSLSLPVSFSVSLTKCLSVLFCLSAPVWVEK